MNSLRQYIGERLATWLTAPRYIGELYSDVTTSQVLEVLRPGDVLLVEGTSRISVAIKYLTQSTWSHAAIYVGQRVTSGPLAGKPAFVEADTVAGVIAVPVAKYQNFNTRILRAHNLDEADRTAVVDYVLQRMGHQYDLKNIFDLLRYMIPLPPVPARYRRRLIAFGSGSPTSAICSTLIAQAFQSVRYPILPSRYTEYDREAQRPSDEVLLKARHYSHFTPRDFDVSPYFEIVKPTLAKPFDYRELRWKEAPVRDAGG